MAVVHQKLLFSSNSTITVTNSGGSIGEAMTNVELEEFTPQGYQPVLTNENGLTTAAYVAVQDPGRIRFSVPFAQSAAEDMLRLVTPGPQTSAGNEGKAKTFTVVVKTPYYPGSSTGMSKTMTECVPVGAPVQRGDRISVEFIFTADPTDGTY